MTALKPTRSQPLRPRDARSRDQLADRVLDRLRKFIEDRGMTGKHGRREFAEFEKELHERLMEAEREIVGAVMAASDVDADAIEINGRTHRRVLRSAETYMTGAGPVRVERWLYKDRADPAAHAVAAMDLKLGIVEGFWTPGAAEQAAWVVAQMTPQKGEELFERIGNMNPSKSSLDRLPKAVSERWEEDRWLYEDVLRKALVIPEGTRSILVSLDGVLAPIDGGRRAAEVRDEAAAEGRLSKGPAGYREVGCAAIGFCDDKGDIISAIRFGRAPESKKLSLKDTLSKDVAHLLSLAPDVRLVKIADAGSDNWSYLATLPEGPEILDFFHAIEHLSAALSDVYGDGTLETRNEFERLRGQLLHEAKGVDKVIRALSKLHREHPRRSRVEAELEYFRKNKARMQYAKWRSEGLPIGSGLVEASCKTLVAQRLKLSGMRWASRGAQAILTMRGWDQSERFDLAWALVAATYECEVHVLANIVELKPPPAKKPSRHRR